MVADEGVSAWYLWKVIREPGGVTSSGEEQAAVMEPPSAIHQSLSSFFQALRRQSSLGRHPSSTDAGLRAFFEAFRRLQSDKPQPPPPTSPAVDGKRLATFFEIFPRLYREQQRSGGLINPWAVSGLGRDEVRNSAVLAWLFDNNGSHGLGNAFLCAFLRIINHGNRDPIIPSHELADYAVFPQRCSVHGGTDRVDLIVDGANFLIYIEVKIDAFEGPEQIKRYLEGMMIRAKTLRKQYSTLIYLTRERQKPRDLHDATIALASWQDVAEAIEAALREEGIKLDQLPGVLLNTLSHHLRSL